VAELLGGREIGDPRKAIVVTTVVDSLAVQSPRQPLSSVDPNLDFAGEPSLQSGPEEAELGVDPVFVDVQTLGLLGTEFESFGFGVPADAKSAARLQTGEGADQTFGHRVFVEDVPCPFVLADARRAEIPDRPLAAHGLG